MKPHRIDRIAALRERLVDAIHEAEHRAGEVITNGREWAAGRLREAASLLCDDVVTMDRETFDHWRGTFWRTVKLTDEIRETIGVRDGLIMDELRRLKALDELSPAFDPMIQTDTHDH